MQARVTLPVFIFCGQNRERIRVARAMIALSRSCGILLVDFLITQHTGRLRLAPQVIHHIAYRTVCFERDDRVFKMKRHMRSGERVGSLCFSILATASRKLMTVCALIWRTRNSWPCLLAQPLCVPNCTCMEWCTRKTKEM